jgi:tetratricopeptide (TPR) repeat protein
MNILKIFGLSMLVCLVIFVMKGEIDLGFYSIINLTSKPNVFFAGYILGCYLPPIFVTGCCVYLAQKILWPSILLYFYAFCGWYGDLRTFSNKSIQEAIFVSLLNSFPALIFSLIFSYVILKLTSCNEKTDEIDEFFCHHNHEIQKQNFIQQDFPSNGSIDLSQNDHNRIIEAKINKPLSVNNSSHDEFMFSLKKKIVIVFLIVICIVIITTFEQNKNYNSNDTSYQKNESNISLVLPEKSLEFVDMPSQNFLKNFSLAESGDSDAQYIIGLSYLNGDQGVPVCMETAMNWIEKSALQGHEEAIMTLGDIYANGKGIDKNFIKAIPWYEKAMEMENLLAINKLGCIYTQGGNGVTKDDDKALKYLKISSEKGSALASGLIGFIYEEKHQNDKALEWFLKYPSDKPNWKVLT